MSLLVGSVWACAGPERKIDALVEEAAAQLCFAERETPDALERRLTTAVGRVVADPFSLVTPATRGRTLGAADTVALVTQFVGEQPHCAIETTAVQVELRAGGRRAIARGNAAFSATQPGDLHAARFVFEAFANLGEEGWRIERLILTPDVYDLPEARP